MNKATSLWLGLLSLGMLCFLCIVVQAPIIERDLMGRTKAVLAANAIPLQGLGFDGRDAWLIAPEGSPLIGHKAVELVAGVNGVRSVHIRDASPPSAAEIMPEPAPKPADRKEETQQAVNAALRGRTIEFGEASAELTAAGRAVLDGLVPVLTGSPHASVEIQGYTDGGGDEQLNVELSRARAFSVKTYLIRKGISAARLSATGLGPSTPIATNATPEGRKRNRRIEFLVKEKY